MKANVQDGQSAGAITVPTGSHVDGWEWFSVGPCKWCGESSPLQANARRLAEWNSGMDWRDVWPNMNDEIGALVQDGTHPECGRVQRDHG